MPAQNGRWSHHDDGLKQLACSASKARDEPPVESVKARMRHGPSQHEELLAEQEVFGGERGAQEEESRQGGDYGAKKIHHAAIVSKGALYVQVRRCGDASRFRLEFLRRTGRRADVDPYGVHGEGGAFTEDGANAGRRRERRRDRTAPPASPGGSPRWRRPRSRTKSSTRARSARRGGARSARTPGRSR